jgi:hydroxymethylpyrimidine/phosphomethylpyrimidine kinase
MAARSTTSSIPPIALTIAGSDPSGGAGVQADLKTFSALGVYGASVLTSLTAQNTRGVTAVHDPPVSFLLAQLEAVLGDLDVAAIKIGMLSRPKVVRAVAERLRPLSAPIVLDPVMVAKGGAALLSREAVAALRDDLVPRCTVLTPNVPEAAVLLGESEEEVRRDMAGACGRLLKLGPAAVLLKGGHCGGETSDDYYRDAQDGGGVRRLTAQRIRTRNTHGTGCTLSAALAAYLALGEERYAAARRAKEYLTAALGEADRLLVGAGHGPVHHFHGWW